MWRSFTFSPHSFIFAVKFLNRSLRPLQVSTAASSSSSDTSGRNQRVKGSGTSASSRSLLRIREVNMIEFTITKSGSVLAFKVIQSCWQIHPWSMILYDSEKGFKMMPSSFHDIGDIEFQDNWGNVWVDLGTCDYFAIDVLLNCLTSLSSEYLVIQQVVFGGRSMGDWEEGMTNPDYGYKYFRR